MGVVRLSSLENVEGGVSESGSSSDRHVLAPLKVGLVFSLGAPGQKWWDIGLSGEESGGNGFRSERPG